MPIPGEHKTVQARILEYAEAIGWTFVSREEAERRRESDSHVSPKDRPIHFCTLLHELMTAKMRVHELEISA